MLFASSGAQSQLGVAADYTLPIPTTTGFQDCVSWGSFDDSGHPLPSAIGGNVDPAGIPDTSAIERSIARGCSTMLEGADDTNRPADWSDATSQPRGNAARAPEKPCPVTIITKRPKAKIADRSPTFKFKASPAHATFACKLDAKP